MADSDLEEILLHNPDEPHFSTDVSAGNKLTVKFVQANRINMESKNFSIYDNKLLKICSFRNNIKQQYWVNLGFINPKPLRKFMFNRLWLWLTVIFLCSAGLLHYTPWMDNIPYVMAYKNSIIIMSFTIAAMSIITLLGKARSVVYLKSTYGATPLVELLYNNPNKTAYHQFLQQITNSSRFANTQEDADLSQLLAAELKEHRRLRDQGVLSDENYRTAKEKIFSLHSSAESREKILPY